MKHASLFSGIGGFDLAAQWMGWENVFQVEIDGFCQKVLAKNFPNVKRYGDIKEFNGTAYRGAIDVLSGGFPCQPFSVAGKRKGKEDDRHLWPQMFRIVREVKPRWIVGENVTGIIGLALDQVLTEMENEGYHTETYIIPACAVNAPHRRDRVWIVAYRDGESRDLGKSKKRIKEADIIRVGTDRAFANSNGHDAWGCGYGEIGCPESKGQVNEKKWQRIRPVIERTRKKRTITNSNELNGNDAGYDTSKLPQSEPSKIQHNWECWPTQSSVCGGNDGVPNRVDRIKSLGNAIVPQVAFEIFKAIENIKGSAKIAQPDLEQSEVEKQC